MPREKGFFFLGIHIAHLTRIDPTQRGKGTSWIYNLHNVYLKYLQIARNETFLRLFGL